MTSASPFFVLYAQEARKSSLWTLSIALSSAVFLRALKLGGGRRWALYAATGVFGLVSHYFFALVVAVHGLYLLVLRWSAPGAERPSLRALVS